MMKKFTKLLVGLLLLVFVVLPKVQSATVDEPMGAMQRPSLGLTLWHLGHNATYIDGFHNYLTAHGIDPLTLDPPANSSTVSQRLLLEPEFLPATNLNINGAGWAWTTNDMSIHSSVHDPGAGSPAVSMPLTIPLAGRYRLWVRYYGFTSGYGPISFKMYKNGAETNGPALYDEVYDVATPTEGWFWKDIIVDLAPGTYTIYLAHEGHGWRDTPGGANGYCERNIDCVYLTDELWADAPSDAARQDIRNGSRSGIQWTVSHAMTTTELNSWRLWQVRPVAWEEQAAKPSVFTQSHAYWRSVVDSLATPDYGNSPPSFRSANRQNIFDERWNMMANPVRIARQAATLQGDILPPGSPKLNEKYYWMMGNQFDQFTGSGWYIDGTTLTAQWGGFDGVASHDYTIDVPGTYYVWVHFAYNWVFGPWYMTVSNAQNQMIRFDYYTNNLPGGASETWQRFTSTIPMTSPGNLHISVAVPQDPEIYQNGSTYRWIKDVLITTDSEYVPQGTVRPPISAAQYTARAQGLGAGTTYPYFLWLPGNAYDPILQDQWPAAAVPSGNASKALSMVRNTHRAVHLPMRSIVSNAVTLTVSPGVLQGSAGTYANKVTWRVVSYDPYGGEYDRQAWTPFVLLQRPNITIPPYNMAALWLDIDSTGVAPGDYTCDVVLSGAATPNRTVTLNVHVSAVDTSTASPVLLGGWNQPPEGEIYKQDFTDHGMTIWYGEMSKAEMVARGIKLLSIGIWWGDPAYLSGIVNRLLSMGLSYNDFVFSVMDEPNGSTQAELQNYIDMANAIHAADPNVRVSFNPGEAASLATFQILNPYCQVWLPFALHTGDPAKMAIITSKPWMWYTTPDLWDKSPGNPGGMYGLARWIPAQPTNCIGAAFFAFNYMWRDHWDTGYEVVVDEAETVLPSRNGPVPTRVWDAIREGTQDAKLGFLVKQKLGGVLNTTEQSFVANSKTEELISWLEHPAPATPTFSLAVAIYPEGQTQMVTIASATSGASIRYTTDGSTPSATVGTLYTGPVPLSSTTVLKAIAYKSGLYDSAVASVTYTFLPPCAAPTFAPADGSYSLYFGGQAVTLSSATSGATIRYTTDGSTPSPTVGAVFTGTPIPFSAMPVRLKAIAYKAGMADSPVAPFHGTCSIWTKMNVLDALADGASLYNGKMLSSVGDLVNASNGYLPTLFASGGPVVVKSGANTLSGHQGLYFPSGAKLDAGSGGGSGIDGGNYQTVAFIFKTTVDNCVLFRDGSWGLVIKDGKLRLAVRSYNGGHWGGWACDPWLPNPSSLGSNVTHPTLVTDGNVHTVTFVVTSGMLSLYVDGVGASVSMSGYYGQAPGNQGNTIMFGSCPRDGGGPCAAEAAMANMFTGSIGEIITFQNAFAATEAQAMDFYLRNFNASCATPTFSPTPGTYTGAQSVTISSATSGSTIRYTTDGSTPSPTAGTVYSAPVVISADTTLKAIAYKTGMADSAVASGTYTIQSATCSLWTKMSAIDAYADGFTLADWTMLPSFGTLTNASNGFLPKLFTLGNPVVAKNGANTLNGHQAIYFPAGAKLDAGTGGGTGIDGGNYQTVSFILKTTVDNCVLFRDNVVVALVIKDGKLRLAIRNYNGGHWGGWACDPWLSNPAYLGPNVTHPTSVTDGNVHTVVMVVTPTALSLFVDGVVSRVSLNGYYGQPPANQGNSITFGSCAKEGSSSCAAETPMANNFSGSIGEVMTYQNSFSDTDAQATDLYLKQKYGIQEQCATPSFSPAPGAYSDPQSVTISTATSGATIRYTVDGSTPSSTVGTVYAAPVAITANTTLKAIAYKSGIMDSVVASGDYVIQLGICSLWTKMSAIDSFADGFTLADWTMLPSFGTLTNASNGFLPKLFTLGSPVVAKNGANTLNGHQAIYLPAGAKLDAGTGGGTGIDGGNYQTVSFIFKTTTDNCVLFRDNNVLGLVVKNGKLRLAIRNYNGGHWGGWACDPWLSDPAYLGPNITHPTFVTDGNVHTVVMVVTPTVLSLFVDGVASSVSLNGYYGQPPANQGNSITFGSCDKYGSSSCAGEAPMANTFSGSIGEVMTYQNSFSDAQAQATDLYLKQKYGIQGQCAIPSFSPAAGSYSNAQSVTISTATSGATIRYTVDGSTPSSTLGAVYSTPVAISTNTTLKAIAYKSGVADSSVASGIYTIVTGGGSGNGLVAHWKLDETSGTTAADSSGYGHAGTLVNGPTWVAGQVGGAVQFAGGSQCIVADNVPVNTTGGDCNTVAFWMKWDGTENQMPFGWNGLYDLWFNNGSFGINTAQSDIYGIASTGLASQWVHVAVVFPNGVPSAANAKIYINGVQQTITQRLGSSVSRTATPGVLISGWGNDGNYKFSGTIDDVRIYNRELSAGEVAALGAVGAGYISREVWTGVGGVSVADIPVTTTPAISDTLTNMETPTDWLDNYGTRLRGYITAPSSGAYTFWVASDDNSELWLSTNDQPANKVLIASVSSWTSSREWTRYASQKSAAITLSAGQRYYVEVLQKEGGGGDNLAVGWAKPGESTSAPSEVIPGSRLSPWSGSNRPAIPAVPNNLAASVISSSQINLSWTDNANNEMGSIIERKTGSGGTYAQIALVASNVISYQDTGLAEGTLYYYRVCATNAGGSSAYSAEANATTAVALPAAPSGLSAVAVSNNQINLVWTDNAANETGFKIERSLTSGSGFSEIATAGANVTSYQNTGLSPATVYYYRVRANNAGGDSAYSAEASTTTGGLPSPWITQDIGTVGKVGSASYSNGLFTIKGAGADIAGTADAFRYVHQLSSGDCELKIRVTSVSNTSAAAKAGVMIRESLNANAREAGVWVSPSSGIIFTCRTNSGGTTVTSTSTGKTAPYWVRVLRAGNSFSAYYGTNGTSWTQLGTTRSISMSTNAYMGLGVSSKVTNTLNTATMGNVTATP